MIETPYLKTFKAYSIIEGIRFGKMNLYGFYSNNIRPHKSIQIENITNSNPARITVPCHGIEHLDQISIMGVEGMESINTSFGEVISDFVVIDENTIEMTNIDSTGFATYIGGGTIKLYHRNTSCGKSLFDCSDSSKNLISRNILGYKKIEGDCVQMVIPRRNWTRSEYYPSYSTSSCFGKETITRDCDCPSTVQNSDYFPYVVNSSGDVYLIVDNSNGSPSIIEPIHKTPWIEVYNDGYSWQYLYSVDLKNDKFVTDDYIPVRDLCVNDGSFQWNTQISKKYNSGQILNVRIVNNGEGYQDGEYEVDIVGDGYGAKATITVTNGKVTSSRVSNRGNNYSYANILSNFETSTEPACFEVSTEPSFSIGKEAYLNLAPSAIMFVWDFDSDEGGEFMVDNDYCGYGLAMNIKENEDVGNCKVYDARTKLTLVNSPSTMIPNERIYTDNASSYVTEIKGPNNNEVYVLPASGQGFSVGDNVFGETSGSNNIISEIERPQVEIGSGTIIAYNASGGVINRDSQQRERHRVIIEL